MSAQRGPPDDPPPRERAPAAPGLAVEDFRSLRRWLVVLGLIAVLAAAAAALALVKADESESEAADEERVVLLERSLERRIAEMDTRLARTSAEIDKQERRLRRAGEETDVARLDQRLRRVESSSARLRRVEDDATDAVEAASEAGERLGSIERRLAALRRDVRRLR